MIGERYAPEAATVNSQNPVVPRQPLVDEGVVGVQQFGHARLQAFLLGAGHARHAFLHLAQFRALLGEGGSQGRRFDFLLQEMNREANTIGSKSADAEISHLVVAMKAELEKIREQVQNVE